MSTKVFPPTKIYLDNSPVHGKGIFAAEKILKDEVFDENIFLTLPLEKDKTDYTEFETNLFNDYRFNWPHGRGWEKLVLPMGFGCFYNHSSEPSAFWRSNLERQTFEFVAYRDIEPGEEIFVWYGSDDYFKTDNRTKI